MILNGIVAFVIEKAAPLGPGNAVDGAQRKSKAQRKRTAKHNTSASQAKLTTMFSKTALSLVLIICGALAVRGLSLGSKPAVFSRAAADSE
jgi:hypothetical protein